MEVSKKNNKKAKSRKKKKNVVNHPIATWEGTVDDFCKLLSQLLSSPQLTYLTKSGRSVIINQALRLISFHGVRDARRELSIETLKRYIREWLQLRREEEEGKA